MSSLKVHLLKLIALGGGLLLYSCTWNESSILHKVVIKVEDQEMTSKQFADELAHRLSKYDALTAKDNKVVSQAKDTIVNEFILSSVLQLWAKKNTIQISKENLDSETKRIRSGFPDEFSFREELTRQGLSIHQWQKTVENRMIEKAIFEQLQKNIPSPSEETIKSYYEKNKQKYKFMEKIYLQQIVLAGKTDADRILVNLKQGKAFEGLAKQFSITPEGKDGGNVGWIERGTLEVFDKAFSLALGTLSEVIQSPYGYHIMLVVKKSPPGIHPLSSVHDSIKRELASQSDQVHFTTWLSQQVRSLHVFKDQKFIESLSVETRKE